MKKQAVNGLCIQFSIGNPSYRICLEHQYLIC